MADSPPRRRCQAAAASSNSTSTYARRRRLCSAACCWLERHSQKKEKALSCFVISPLHNSSSRRATNAQSNFLNISLLKTVFVELSFFEVDFQKVLLHHLKSVNKAS